MIKIKRIYDPYDKDDGARILVDRLWPRGISKERAHLTLWLKEIAPSDELRMWFNHDPKKWVEFQRKYKKELENKKDYIEQLKNVATNNTITTLLYSAKDAEHNQAVFLSGLFT